MKANLLSTLEVQVSLVPRLKQSPTQCDPKPGNYPDSDWKAPVPVAGAGKTPQG